MKNHLKISLSFFLFWAIIGKGIAQESYELNSDLQEKMKPFAVMEGRWKGSGWMMGEDRRRRTFTQEEVIQFKLSGTVLEIEGKGMSNGTVVHHALALISPGKEGGKYEFNSILQSGMKGTYPAYWENGKLIWQPVEQVRYVIEIDEEGRWFEIGEYNAGTQWYKFMEMTLEKVQ